MDNFQRLRQQVVYRLFACIGLVSIVTTLLTWVCSAVLHLSPFIALGAGLLAATIIALVFVASLATTILEPLHRVWQAVLYVSPHHQGTPAPQLDHIRIGRQLVSTMITQIYQFASQEDSKDLIAHRKEIIQSANIVSHLPLPLFVFNKQLLVTNASNRALEYCEIESAELFGKPIYESLHLEFPSEFTLEQWIQDCQSNRVTNDGYWERVRVRSRDGENIRQCDMTAYYNRDNPSGADFIVTLFDRTAQYDEDDRSMSFVALAVHELRTPLTMLRGYIEVFQEELGGQVNAELGEFMTKMEASANRLTSFVHNILNVARIDADQLTLHLNEDNWPDVLQQGASDQIARAQALGKTIEFHVQPNLPTVAVDRISMYEVLNNLLDNAIKYSPQGERIIVTSKLNAEGKVETTIQDFGVGIPASVLSNLFEKFYRSHRTRSNIGGTGLGLYLSKALVNAHGGQIWASSKEGEGSTFGFTVIPYNQLTDEQKASPEGGITRQAHGWIKNHSIYRR